jgi:hypothetical protein
VNGGLTFIATSLPRAPQSNNGLKGVLECSQEFNDTTGGCGSEDDADTGEDGNDAHILPRPSSPAARNQHVLKDKRIPTFPMSFTMKTTMISKHYLLRRDPVLCARPLATLQPLGLKLIFFLKPQ